MTIYVRFCASKRSIHVIHNCLKQRTNRFCRHLFVTRRHTAKQVDVAVVDPLRERAKRVAVDGLLDDLVA